MASETVYAVSSVSGSAPNPNLALGAPNGTWAGITNSNTSWTHRWAMGLPQNTELDTKMQTFQILVRKGSNSNNPTVSFRVYINGSLAAQNSPVSIASTSGVPLSMTYTPSAPTTVQSIEIEVIVSASGGNQSARNSIEIDALTATLQVPDPPPNDPPVAVVTYPQPRPNASFVIDGSQSYDPDGWITAWEWNAYPLAPSQPGSIIWNGDRFGPTVSVTLSHPGTYYLQLTITDNSGMPTVYMFSPQVISNKYPVIVGQLDYETTVGEPVTIDLSGSYDPDGTLDYWYVYPIGQPPDSTLPVGSGPTWVFTPTSVGTYVFSISVFDDEGGEVDKTVSIIVSPGTTPTVTKYLYDGANLIPLGVTVLAT